MKPNGVITLEFPHLLQLMQNNQFDTIYHEHFSYFSLITAKKIFEYHGLKIFDVEELSTHGGSLRLYITHFDNNQINKSTEVDLIIEKEKKFGLTQINTYENFSKNIIQIKINLLNFIEKAKKNSKTLVCYGAPAKGNTLLNYCGLSKTQIDYTVDKNPSKQNLFLPGTHIPIFSPEKIKETKPDFILILPWNLQEEILNELNYVKSWGCQFIISIPEVKVLQ